ncbi:hypothetical protein BFJ63_vAg15089 [Fusarium oxysporum f. sp. narcissi]|uniref:Cupin type-2 domain-containing protein n=3 Tax=Fusarium oxysporum TaxID=5507 RepID=A0A2H3GKK7_FUSOX|nr:hypothetical protein AU210_012525 [Fusarium oxysporum f. sp. radicis-cucumerinum]RKK10301.1 hypothetical protein BFJ65_g15599 [Fusarium oxysporum f. sp. cepae]RKK84500.1 hypothetical protein BFJ71_g14547 [Fusarium oxysporum]RYC82021.1 hypothetical protein BFJ63_vAg15089 [Fusarium oxysporum f. sp. narcissi]RKK31239.1 hypothetical protein BFJ66_g15934 [Fusarium oxysporum f. sp. cepae]
MSLPRVSVPRTDGRSYIVNRMDGEILSPETSRGSFHMYASQVQTKNSFSVFGWDGPFTDSQGYHHHLLTHDCFLVTEGTMLVYCDGESRILQAGDFASVPPGYVHKPTPQGPITRAVPLISPADWVDFFRDRSVTFDNVMFPEFQDEVRKSTMAEMLGEDWKAKYDTYPDVVENVPGPLDWSERDTVIPSETKPYFLRFNTGPRWALGGVTSRPFITTKQSANKFSISSIEGSSVFGPTVLARRMTFPKIHHLFIILDGWMDISVGAEAPVRVFAGEVVFLAANTAFSLNFENKYVRFWSYTNGDGIEALIEGAGEPLARASLPDEAPKLDEKRLRAAVDRLRITID